VAGFALPEAARLLPRWTAEQLGTIVLLTAELRRSKEARMSSLSVLVPRLGASADFEATLASVLRYRLRHHQVVVVHGPDEPDDYGLRDEVDFVECRGPASLGSFLNAGLPHLSGNVIAVIQPGIEVHNHWFAGGVRQLGSADAGCAAVALVSAGERSRVISRGLAASRLMIPRHALQSRDVVAPHSHAFFCKREALESIGPLDESLSDPLLALDLALSMAAGGYQCRCTDDTTLTIRDGSMVRIPMSYATGRDSRRLMARHGASATPGSALVRSLELMSAVVRPSHWPMLAGRRAA
jgi:hypothetical protein